MTGHCWRGRVRCHFVLDLMSRVVLPSDARSGAGRARPWANDRRLRHQLQVPLARIHWRLNGGQTKRQNRAKHVGSGGECMEEGGSARALLAVAPGRLRMRALQMTSSARREERMWSARSSSTMRRRRASRVMGRRSWTGTAGCWGAP